MTGDAIEFLLDDVIDGRCDAARLQEFEVLVSNDPVAREAYFNQMRIHAMLAWHYGQVEICLDSVQSRRQRRVLHGLKGWSLAAMLLIGIGLCVLAAHFIRLGRGGGGGDIEIASLVETRNVVWDEGQVPIAVNSRLKPQTIRCASGVLKLAFDCGAVATLEGQTDLRLLSGTQLQVIRGRITTRVESPLKGFSIETPSTLVVDQGTEFGVEVDSSGQTAVIVFEGLVDLSRAKSTSDPTLIKRLSRGEGMRVGRTGHLSRVVAVNRRSGGDEWSTKRSSSQTELIRSVSDNIRGLDSSKYYQIVPHGLEDDQPAYVDRPHQWNGLDSRGIPEFLRGADYIKTFNDDKWTKNLEISVELGGAATLYVLFDDREETPAWLSSRFIDTGVNIGLDEAQWHPATGPGVIDKGAGRSIDNIFSIWKCELDRAGSIQLGGISAGVAGRAMYGIAAVARP
jgi:ferric-dicitrate binding protein FerR (iron transport regulator)